MAVCMMQAVGPKQAILIVLLLTYFVCSQDHQMLTENCNWATTNLVMTTSGTSVILARPSGHLPYYLVCQTRLYINDLSYTLKLRVRSFDLQGSGYCDVYSERIILYISDTDASKNITLCGGRYAKELILPVQAMTLTYNTGAYDKDSGFQLEFSAVPPSSCYDERKLEVTLQPMLLYSPNFPGNYKSNLNCTVQLYAREDQYIHVQSQLVKIESAAGCIYDALVINDERYCGEDPINVIVPASTVDIRFVSDGTKEMDGFILAYEAVPTEILNCASSVNYSLTATSMTTVIVMNASTSGRRLKRSSRCTVVLDSGSDDDVLDIVFMSDLSDVESYRLSTDGEVQYIHDETEYPQSGKLTIDSGGQNLGATTLNFLHSPTRRVVFSVNLQTRKKFMFNVKAVSRSYLPPSVSANYSLVWVNTHLNRSSGDPQLSVMPAASGENIEVRVFYTHIDRTTLDFDGDRLPVAMFVMVYNGDDTSCFELTQGCSSDMSRQAKSVYSIKSQRVTVVVRDMNGFWMYFAPAAENYLPQPEELSFSDTFSTKIYLVNVKNLFCEWTLSAANQLDIARNGKIIRLKAGNNFVSNSSVETFIVKEENNDVMKYTGSTNSSIWMYSRKAIRITVSVFNSEPNLLPRYFQFESEILDSAADIEPFSCQVQTLQANETVQFVDTPNYPAFFQNKPCEWTIVQDRESGRRNNIVINFPDLSNLLCSEGSEIQIETSNWGDEFISWPQICSVSSFQQSYQYDQVKVTFVSRFVNLLPGFKFTYYISAPPIRDITLLATKEFQFLSSPNYPTSYPSSIDYQWHIMATSISSVVDFDLVDFTLEEETRLQCIHDYVNIYDGSSTTPGNLIKTLCGSVFYGQYSSSDSYLSVVFHSDGQNNYKGFRFKYRSREKGSKEFNISVSGQNITGIIIGVIAGGVVLIALVVAAVIYVLRRRKRPRPNTRTRASAPRRGPVPGSESSVFILGGAPINPDYAPPSYWETHNSLANNDPPSYASVTHNGAAHILPEYAPGYSCENPGLNLLDLPPPYSSELPVSALQPELYLALDAARLDSSSSEENTDNGTWPDPNSATDLRDRDDRLNDSTCDSNPTEDNTTTSVATPATNNHFNNSQMPDPPPAYENTLFGRNNSGDRHDSRRVPHTKNDRLGFL